MTTFDVMNIPNSGIADSDHSFEEVQSMESRMESHLITLSAMITDRESAWDEMDSFDIRWAGLIRLICVVGLKTARESLRLTVTSVAHKD